MDRPLTDFAHDIHSHAGEDGILAEIFRRLGTTDGYLVDVGAWDGLRLSNTRALVEAGWRGLLIEAEADRAQALAENCRGHQVEAVHAAVALHGPESLDAVLDRHSAPDRIDLLDIDIDSDDLAVWMSLTSRRAVCVVVEYNPTIPFDTDFINPVGRSWGNAARTIVRLGAATGYVLVAATAGNLVLVDAALAGDAGLPEVTLDDVARRFRRTHFWGYDGTLVYANASGAHAPETFTVPWHQLEFEQPVPPELRRWSVDGRYRDEEIALRDRRRTESQAGPTGPSKGT